MRAARFLPLLYCGIAVGSAVGLPNLRLTSCEQHVPVIAKPDSSRKLVTADKQAVKSIQTNPTIIKKDTKPEVVDLRVEKAIASALADGYEHAPWDVDKHKHMIKNHALFDTLYDDERVEEYKIFKHPTEQKIMAVIKFGTALNGYPGLLHGGISALVIDNSYGALFMGLGLPPAFTANLNLNYRSPIKQGSVCILRAKVDSIDGRKLRMSATIEDAETGKIQVESTTLFVNMKLTYFQQIAWNFSHYFGFQL